MARRGKRGGKKHRQNQASVGVEESTPLAGGPQNHAVLDGARRSERRGYVKWPTLNTEKEIRPHERIEIMRRVRAGEESIGLVSRSINGVSDLIGNLTPQAATAASAWNEEVEEGMRRRYEEPQAFDQAGELDLFGWQDAIKMSKGRDGDALSALSEGSEKGARIIYYQAHQIGNGKKSQVSKRLPDNLVDGVFRDRWGGRAGFQLLNGDGSLAKRVPRESGIYHADIRRPGRPRQVSGLAHAVSNWLDMVEIVADTKHAVKVAALWGAVLESNVQSSGGRAVTEQLKQFWNSPSSGGGDGGGGEVITLESVTRGGRFQGLNPGQQIKTIQDTRPHPNVIALLAFLIRDMAWGVGLPPEILWDASGLSGTAVRYVMAEVRRFVKKRLRALRRDCRRWWFYALSKEIKAGRISEPPSGLERWWASEWIPDADPTIDLGRDGKLELEQVDKGLKTRKQAWAEKGLDWREQERQLREEERYRRELDEEFAG